MTATDTIFALATPPGRSAIAVVRLSGPAVPAVLTALCGRVPPPRRATLASLVDPDDGTPIDRALVLYLAAPHTPTGEPVAELHLHGGRAVIRAALGALARRPSVRPAAPGEFAQRAFIAGRLDLAELEGLADLIDAETEAQRRQALAALSGTRSTAYAGWRERAVAALGLIEAAIDFADEDDIADRAVRDAEALATALAGDLHAALADGHRGEIVRDGFRVVLAGPPNAGKSSLLNALARRDAAIVSDEPGTTRDVIEVRLDLFGLPIVIADTAGLRETDSRVEREGIRRTLDVAGRADLVLWLVEPGGPTVPPPAIAALNAPLIVVATKADLAPATPEPAIPAHTALGAERIHVKQTTPDGNPKPLIHVKQSPLDSAFRIVVSAHTGAGLDALVAHLADAARTATGQPGEALITEARHRHEIAAAHDHLTAFLADRNGAVELRAEAVRRAADAIGRLTGRINAEEVLGAIFGRFCIGK